MLSGTVLRCAKCGRRHRVAEMELAFRRPDEFFNLYADDRKQRAEEDDDICILDRTRYFTRSILPLPVRGRDYPYCIGLWVELDRAAAVALGKGLRSRKRLSVGPLLARVANRIPLVQDSFGLPVALILSTATAHAALESFWRTGRWTAPRAN